MGWFAPFPFFDGGRHFGHALAKSIMAKLYVVYRSVDGDIEFRGLRGMYFYYAAVGSLGSLVLAMLFYILGVPILLVILLLIVGAGGTIFWAVRANTRYGKWGHVKQPQPAKTPDFVYQTASFRALLPIRQFDRVQRKSRR